MIPLLTRAAVRAIDREAIDRFGVPGLVLMENAGAGATRELLAAFSGQLARPLVLGGTGQNGGDAWVVARHLLNAGVRPEVVLIGALERVAGDARVNLDALLALGVPVKVLVADAGAALDEHARHATLIVDGLFGTGLDRPVTGVYAVAIEATLRAHAPLFALDLPSGIDADTGQVLNVATRAAMTATFAAHKRGLHQYPGVEHAGEVRLVSIGVPPPSTAECALLEPSDVRAWLPARARDAHKGSNGHVLAIAGSAGKTGAALLAALGAMRAGAGLVTIATSADARHALDQKVIEIMTAELTSTDPVASALALAHDKDSVLLGPGLGLSDAARELARRLALELPLPCVIDADALTSLGGDVGMLRTARAARILTPHPGEAARLLQRSVAAVQADRYGAARELSELAGHVVALKGAQTVIADPSGQLRVCGRGTPALGVGGTGDVLAGTIAALAVSCPAWEAACAGVELHGLAGELAAVGDRGTFASDVAACIPRALQRCRAQT